MGFTIYSPTDAGAPTLTGEVGSLVALLDACLVTGYGSKAAAGWTKPYTGTNKAVFTQGADSCGYSLRVQDDAPGAGGAREARITGYETMSDVDTGVNPFPLATTQTELAVNAYAVHKSDAASAAAVQWMVFADSRTFYFFVTTLTAAALQVSGNMGFGDFYSLYGGKADGGRCILLGNTEETLNLVSQTYMNHLSAYAITHGTWGRSGGTPNAAGPRGLDNLRKSSVVLTLLGDYLRLDNISGYAAGQAHVLHTGTPTVWMPPVVVGDVASLTVRGRLRGIYQWLHPQVLGSQTVVTGDIITGTGETAGKSFMAISLSPAATAMVEISDTLETNI